jgi:hypothetical protein
MAVTKEKCKVKSINWLLVRAVRWPAVTQGKCKAKSINWLLVRAVRWPSSVRRGGRVNGGHPREMQGRRYKLALSLKDLVIKYAV